MKLKFHLLGLIILAAAIAGFSVYEVAVNGGRRDSGGGEPAAKAIVCQKIKKIDGLCFLSDEEPLVYAVMIENHLAARPVSGINEASLVYEAVVEAPITRFLAILSADRPIEKIGPLRSARPFYIDWAEEFGAPYLHVGGSDEALNILKNYKFDLNEFYNGQYFWRAASRSMPHNVYTSTELLEKAVSDKKWALKNDFFGWKFAPASSQSGADASASAQLIKVDFGTPEFSVEWHYDPQQKTYVRYQAGEVYKDSAGVSVTAENVAIMHTSVKVIDSYGRRKIKTLGSGKAIVFRGNEAIVGEWRRANLSERTRFYNEQGEEVSFYPGKTWIEVIGNDL